MSAESRARFNGVLPGEAKPPTPVKFDALETRTIAERIEAFVDRTFTMDYHMAARPKPPAWRHVDDIARVPMTLAESPT